MEQKLSDLLLILLGIAIILIFIINFVPFLSESGSKASCKNWVNMQSRMKIAGIEIPSIFDSPCITSFNKIKTNDKNEIHKQLAEDMYDCWDMYGAGKIDFYSDWDFWKSDTHCLVCKEIEVDKDVDTEIDINNFEEYLSDHNPPNHKETYAEYFLGPDHSSIDFGTGMIKLNNEASLYTMFVVNKRKEPMQFGGSDMIVTGAFCVTGAKVGAGIGALITFFTGGAGAIPGGAIGCGIGILTGVSVSVAGQANLLYPSIFLASGEEVLEKGCNEIYYKPQKKIGGII